MTHTENVVLVTGGSRGIGAAACLRAAELGHGILVNYVSNRQAAEEVVAQIERAEKHRFEPIAMPKPIRFCAPGGGGGRRRVLGRGQKRTVLDPS